jgi:Na+/H+ antiporter NhaB
MMQKIIGAGIFLLGLAIVIGFPYMKEYTPDAMTNAGVILGLILIGIGIYLMKT